jgi:hypothetical protein
MARLTPVPRGTVRCLAAAVLTAVVVAACASPGPSGSSAANGGSAPIYTAGTLPPVLTGPYRKVMVIAEENEAASSVIGSSSAPYINALARSYGQASNMQAGYPVSCPSLAAYVIMTSGAQQGICDDNPPSAHPLSVDNIFQQVAAAGLQWREYAE